MDRPKPANAPTTAATIQTGMKHYKKHDLPVDQTRRYLEPGPIVLVSSQWKAEHDIMTMGWHMMLGYDLVGTYIWTANHSYDLIRKSKACVINLPTIDLANQVVGIGNTTGTEIDKFKNFHLTPEQATEVTAPLIKDCYANFECRLHERQPNQKTQPLHLACGQSPRSHQPQIPKDPALPRRGKIHDLRPRNLPPQKVQTRDAAELRQLTPQPSPSSPAPTRP